MCFVRGDTKYNHLEIHFTYELLLEPNKGHNEKN